MAALLKALRTTASVRTGASVADLLGMVRHYSTVNLPSYMILTISLTGEEMSEAWQSMLPSTADTEYGSRNGSDSDLKDPCKGKSTRALYFLDESLNTTDRVRAAGFVGESSEMQWLRAAAMVETDRANEKSGRAGPHLTGSCTNRNDHISSYSFWTDDENADVDSAVDPHELPQPDMAERLLWCYMVRVQDSFPILSRTCFQDQFQRHFAASRNENGLQLDPQWQVVLNLVFAIGAKYLHSVNSGGGSDKRDHSVFQARARAFGVLEAGITNHSDRYHIQILGLLAFYWLSTGHINR